MEALRDGPRPEQRRHDDPWLRLLRAQQYLPGDAGEGVSIA